MSHLISIDKGRDVKRANPSGFGLALVGFELNVLGQKSHDLRVRKIVNLVLTLLVFGLSRPLLSFKLNKSNYKIRTKFLKQNAQNLQIKHI